MMSTNDFYFFDRNREVFCDKFHDASIGQILLGRDPYPSLKAILSNLCEGFFLLIGENFYFDIHFCLVES